MSSRHRSVVRSPTWPRRSANPTCAVAQSAGVLVRQVDFLEQLMPSVSVLAKFAYQRPDQFFPRLKGDLAAAMAQHADNPVVQELGSGGYERVVALLEEWRPDAVVSVVPVGAAVASEAASALGFVSAAVITDFSLHDAWLHPGTDAYFVASRDVSDALVVAGVEWGRVSVSGSARFRRRDCRCRAARRIARRWGSPTGSRARLRVPAVVLRPSCWESRRGQRLPESRWRSRPAPRPVSPDRLRASSKSSELVRPWATASRLAQLISAADVVVSRAGHIGLYAALSLKVPLIIYTPVPGQERFNVDYLVNCGAALLARDEDDACEKLRFLSTHPERLSEMAGHAGALGRPDATRTVCERVLASVT